MVGNSSAAAVTQEDSQMTVSLASTIGNDTKYYLHAIPPIQIARIKHRSRNCILFLALMAIGLLSSKQAWAGVAFTIPGAGVQVTGPVPLVVSVSSAGPNITNVQVLDGSTQIGSYAGNGSATINIHAVYALTIGSHTLTVKGTDANGNTYTGTQTFSVSGNGSVTQSPSSEAENPAPVTWQATCAANSGHVINAMNVYGDFQPTPIGSFTGLNSSSVTESESFDTSSFPAGADGHSHSLTTNCWDETGQVYQSSIDFAFGSAFPGAPGSAVILNMDNPSSGWQACPGCSGTPGGDATESMTYPAVPPNFPTIDDDSRNFTITSFKGSTFQGFLWFTNFTNTTGFGPNGPVAWIFDYYVNVSNPLSPDSAVEFDGNQVPGSPSGDSFVLGTECNYGANPLPGNPTVWRFFDGNLGSGKGSWNDTYNSSSALSCPVSSAGHWYHVQMYFTVDAGSFTYTLHNVRVKDTNLNSILQDSSAAFTFKGVIGNHGNGIDVQLDGNNNHTYAATYDKITITRW